MFSLSSAYISRICCFVWFIRFFVVIFWHNCYKVGFVLFFMDLTKEEIRGLECLIAEGLLGDFEAGVISGDVSSAIEKLKGVSNFGGDLGGVMLGLKVGDVLTWTRVLDAVCNAYEDLPCHDEGRLCEIERMVSRAPNGVGVKRYGSAIAFNRGLAAGIPREELVGDYFNGLGD